MYKLILPFLFILCSMNCLAQDRFSISGTIHDSSANKIQTALLQILNAKDSSIYKLTVSNKGSFLFDSIAQGNYLLRISASGFDNKIQSLDVSKNLVLNIVLHSKSTSLKDIKIVGSKKSVSIKNGNIKFNIENTILANEANTIDLLSKLPAVQLSSDKESISLVGKGSPLIYINNQQSTLIELSSLSVSDIKSIEIIQNPSSKYEADGRAVILVTRKIGSKEGVRVEAKENLSIKRYFNNQIGTNASIKQKKLELKLNATYNYFEHWEGNQHTFNIIDKDVHILSNITSFGPRNQLDLGGGIYYQINHEDYFSMNIVKRIPIEYFDLNGNSLQRIQGSEDSTFNHSNNTSHRPFFTSNFNFNKTLKKVNGQLFVGAQYSRFTRNVSSKIYDDTDPLQSSLTQERIQNFHVDGITGRVDFEKTFKNKLKYECGMLATKTLSNTWVDIQEYNPSIINSSRFVYHENDLAAYTQVSGSLGIIKYQSGLRAENTKIQSGYKDSANLLVDKNYLQIFPKAGIDIEIDSSKTLSLNYSKNIQRPNYSFANQVTTYINPYLQFANNIGIRPSVSQELAASFQYNENSVRLSVYTIQDPVYGSVSYDETKNQVTLMSKNFTRENGIDLNITIPLKYKKWSSTNTADISLASLKDIHAVRIASKPCYYLYSQNQFTLPKAYTYILTAWWISDKSAGIIKEHSMYSVDMGLSKTLRKKLKCTVSWNDIFRSMNYLIDFTINQVESKSLYYEDNREFAINLNYTFGKIKDSHYKNKEADDNLNRIR